jgi:hypothetical protein
MTEEEWLAATDPAPMLDFLQGKASDRKLRLFACACSLRMGDSLGQDARSLIAFAEEYADGRADRAARRRLATSDYLPSGVGLLLSVEMDRTSLGLHTEVVARILAQRQIPFPGRHDGSAKYMRAVERILNSKQWKAVIQNEGREQSHILLEVVGFLPFRTIDFDPIWRTSPIVALAESIYREHGFDRLPILADALEDAGCDAAELLAHLRGPGPHVRGCWAVDLVLGKS